MAGLIKEERDPSHKQSIRLHIKDDLRQMAKGLLERRRGTTQEDLAETVAAVLDAYKKVASKINDPLFADFLKRLVSKGVEDALEMCGR